MARPKTAPHLVYLIAAFKLLDGLVLFALAIGMLRLFQRHTAGEIYRWIDALRIDPNNRHIQQLLSRFSMLNERKLRELSVGTFFYSGLHFTEGIGLFLRKRWAEYFTIIITGSFIPLEIYELVKRANPAKGIVLLLNVAVVAYLAYHVRSDSL